MAELADRVFCIYNKPAGVKGRGKVEARTTGEQRTLEYVDLVKYIYVDFATGRSLE